MRAAALACALAAGCGSTALLGDAASTDGAASDGAMGDGSTSSRCAAAGTTLTCTSHQIQVGGRTVTYEVPFGAAPTGGWPSVVFFQGSFVAGSHAFAATKADAFGQYELTSTVQALLDRGYAVIAPNAQNDGSLYWQTNVPPYATSWAGCDDDVFVQHLITATTDATFGALDPGRRYAMGISSGGYMTSRMAVSYAGTFRALAIASASYATCGVTCSVPALPADHPPTLFLHGADDTTVPPSTMPPYRDKLLANGRVADSIVRPGAGHEWLPEGKTAIPAWFDAH